MRDVIALLQNWPFAIWALGLSGAFYYVVNKGSGHLSEDNKARLTLYLEGSYKQHWAENFCALFDTIFGKTHASVQTFVRSAVASVLAVTFIYILFGPVLGLITARWDSAFDLFSALAIGAAINIIPDYLSLWETRRMLATFQRFRHPLVQLCILILDLAVSALIILTGITVFLWITGRDPVSWIEMLALYSPMAIFFYSTFLTSIWAWAYCLSSWFVKTFTALRLHELLDMTTPGKSLALTGSVALFLAAMLAQPLVTMKDEGWRQVDAQFCEWFPRQVCPHVARLTGDQEEKLAYLRTACGGDIRQCLDDGVSVWRIDPKEAVALWTLACTAQDAASCANLGWMNENGRGVPQDYDKAHALYTRACDGGDANGCNNLGWMSHSALGVPQDYDKAHALYTRACDGGSAMGCNNLGWLYRDALGVPQDYDKAHAFYTQACNGDSAAGCASLGWMYHQALGVPRDYDKARTLYTQACDGDSAAGCNNLGWMYDNALGVPQDYDKARALYTRACDGGDAQACANLGWMYQTATGVDRDLDRAEAFYERACKGGDDAACISLVQLQGPQD